MKCDRSLLHGAYILRRRERRKLEARIKEDVIPMIAVNATFKHLKTVLRYHKVNDNLGDD